MSLSDGLVEPMRAAMQAKVAPAPMVPVGCPTCGRALVVFVRATRRLHRVTRGGYLGYPLGDDHRAQVPIRCEACGGRWSTSGRDVARAIYDGQPPLVG